MQSSGSGVWGTKGVAGAARGEGDWAGWEGGGWRYGSRHLSVWKRVPRRARTRPHTATEAQCIFLFRTELDGSAT